MAARPSANGRQIWSRWALVRYRQSASTNRIASASLAAAPASLAWAVGPSSAGSRWPTWAPAAEARAAGPPRAPGPRAVVAAGAPAAGEPAHAPSPRTRSPGPPGQRPRCRPARPEPLHADIADVAPPILADLQAAAPRPPPPRCRHADRAA